MYDSWLAMDHFYYEVFPRLLIAMGIFALIFISGMMNMGNKTIKRIGLLSLGVLIVLGGYCVYGLRQYDHLIHLSQNATPAVREYRRKFMHYDYVPFMERYAYKNGYAPSHFERVELYDVEELVEDVTYLGKYKDYDYFEIDGKPFFCSEKRVEFSQDIDQPIRIGRRFHLKDERFRELGFYEVSPKYQDKFIVPTRLQSLKLSKEDAPNIDYIPDRVEGWIVR